MVCMTLLVTFAGLALLLIGAELLVRGAVSLAFRAGLSPLVVGLTVVSVGTSAPELVVSLVAALHGDADIALANVVGSNVVNITFILGACVAVFPVEVDRSARRVHWPVMMAATLLLWFLLHDGTMSRWDGAFCVAGAVLYVGGMVVGSRRGGTHGPAGEDHAAPALAMAPWKALVFLVTGIAGLTWGADLFVDGAVLLARGLGLSERSIGLTVVAVGTSMPELITSLVAAFRKQADISLGNLIGSNIFNILGILGITSLVLPMHVEGPAFAQDMAALGISALLLFVLMLSGRSLGRWQGLLLLAAYGIYLALLFTRG